MYVFWVVTTLLFLIFIHSVYKVETKMRYIVCIHINIKFCIAQNSGRVKTLANRLFQSFGEENVDEFAMSDIS